MFESFVALQATYTCNQILVSAACQCAVLVRGRTSRSGHKGSARSPLNQMGVKHILGYSIDVFLNWA